MRKLNQKKKINQDYINIERMCVYAYHGVFEEEKKRGQEFFISAKLYYDMRKAAATDDVKCALDYGECTAYMLEVFTEKSYDLIEAAGEELCRRMLMKYPALTGMDLKLSKPHAPVGIPVSDISVNLSREWHRVYLSVGSNMGDRKKYIEDAAEKLCGMKEIRHLRMSSLLETKPYGVEDQPDFLNGAIELETFMEPFELLDVLNTIENEAGRERSMHWGPRTLDLDILLFDKLVLEDRQLILPHVDMENRLFVLEPLAELAPWLRHPILGLTVEQLRERLRGGDQ